MPPPADGHAGAFNRGTSGRWSVPGRGTGHHRTQGHAPGTPAGPSSGEGRGSVTAARGFRRPSRGWQSGAGCRRRCVLVAVAMTGKGLSPLWPGPPLRRVGLFLLQPGRWAVQQGCGFWFRLTSRCGLGRTPVYPRASRGRRPACPCLTGPLSASWPRGHRDPTPHSLPASKPKPLPAYFFSYHLQKIGDVNNGLNQAVILTLPDPSPRL